MSKLSVPVEFARKFPPILLLRIMARVGLYDTRLEG